MVVLSAVRVDFQLRKINLAKVYYNPMYTVKFAKIFPSEILSPLDYQTGHTYGFMGLWSGEYCMVG